MTPRSSYSDQPVGAALHNWTEPSLPSVDYLEGRFCRVEKLNAELHGGSLWTMNSLDTLGRNWTYLPYGPFGSFEEYRSWLHESSTSQDPLFFAITGRSDQQPIGIASYLRISQPNGSIEVGHILFSERLKRTPVATEAMYLLMKKAFDLGYRRYEWKCDSHNTPSRAAAARLGFTYEGTFRQAMVYKGRNRDTSWYSVIDREWPAIRSAFEEWLAPTNFDSGGRQRVSLRDLTQAARLKNASFE